MKKIYFFYLIIILFNNLDFGNQQHLTTGGAAPIVYINNIISSTASSSQVNSVSYKNLLSDLIANNKPKLLSCIDIICRNKFRSSMVAVTSIYLYISYEIFNMQRYLNNKDCCWSYWHSEKTLEKLFEIPQIDLGQNYCLKFRIFILLKIILQILFSH